MANDLVPSTWTPPESKAMQKVVKYGGLALLGIGGILAFNAFAPTMVTFLTLLQQVMASWIYATVTGVGLLGVLFLARETISSNGSINRMLRIPYWAMINGLTRFFIAVDPLSPIDERLKSVRADQAEFEKQYEKFDGIISSLKDKEESYRQMSTKAQKEGIAAQKLGKQGAVDIAQHNFGRFRQAADDYARVRARLEPASATFQRIAEACDVTAQKLETERTILADKWKTQQVVNSATASANRILGRSKSALWDLAEQAELLIDTKYSEELGHLDHLKKNVEPFLQSIDVENATYNEDMFAEVQAGSQRLIQAATGTPLLASPVPAASIPASSDIMTSFIR